jgi:hypothetical protein
VHVDLALGDAPELTFTDPAAASIRMSPEAEFTLADAIRSSSISPEATFTPTAP